MSPHTAQRLLRVIVALLATATVVGWLVALPLVWHFGKHHASLPFAFGFVWGVSIAMFGFVILLLWLGERAGRDEAAK